MPERRGGFAPLRPPVASRVRALSVGVSTIACRRASTALLVAAVIAAWVPLSAAQSAPVDDPLFGDIDSELSEAPAGFPDPLEGANRQTLRFNRVLDRWLLDPVTRVYRKALPPPIKV